MTRRNTSSSPLTTLQQAIRNLDETALQIALAVSADGVLLGTITDGDIRRGLLRGLDLSGPIDSIIFREPLVAPPQLGRDTVLQHCSPHRARLWLAVKRVIHVDIQPVRNAG